VKIEPVTQVPLEGGISIAWREECYRSRVTSALFDTRVFYIWPGGNKTFWQKLCRYTRSVVATWGLIRKHRPRTVVAMNLPVFLPLAVALARPIYKVQLVLDFHSGALTDRKWWWFRPIYRMLVRTASFTICHNAEDGETVSQWGGRVVYLTTLVATIGGLKPPPAPESPTFLAVCSFKQDEPVELMLRAMSMCPQYEFWLTGNWRRSQVAEQQIPSNVRFLGFLEYRDYLEKMSVCSAVITLSKRSHIMQAAIHEALSLGIPVVTNTSCTLEKVLGDAGVYSALNSDELAGAFNHLVENRALIQQKIQQIRAARVAELEECLLGIRADFPDLFSS
jgi:glycosyltransferase involved in cell wall biosynthesis